MKAILQSFKQMVTFLRRDKMLAIACFVPIAAGLFFKLAIPALERLAVDSMGVTAVFRPYYSLIDLLFAAMTPVIFCFVAGMVVLEEHDERIDNYLTVTRLGRKGYLVSRIFIPSASAFVVSLVLLPIFKLTALTAAEIVLVSLTSALQGIIVVLMIIALSTNKLEGMAIAKASTLIILGAIVPYCMPTALQYVACFLPSFWMGKAVCNGNPIYMIPSVVLAAAWIFLLLVKYLRKIF